METGLKIQEMSHITQWLNLPRSPLYLVVQRSSLTIDGDIDGMAHSERTSTLIHA